ncbi:MAG: hypothetical protein VB027_01115 [Gordonibacter sp.]|nr:hypothetical protein [Gordonibacter sp.]
MHKKPLIPLFILLLLIAYGCYGYVLQETLTIEGTAAVEKEKIRFWQSRYEVNPSGQTYGDPNWGVGGDINPQSEAEYYLAYPELVEQVGLFGNMDYLYKDTVFCAEVPWGHFPRS